VLQPDGHRVTVHQSRSSSARPRRLCANHDDPAVPRARVAPDPCAVPPLPVCASIGAPGTGPARRSRAGGRAGACSRCRAGS